MLDIFRHIPYGHVPLWPGSKSATLNRFSTSRLFSHKVKFFGAKIFDNGKYKKHATNKIRSSRPEAFRPDVFCNLDALRNFANSQENICARVSFSIKLQPSGLRLY